MTRGLAAAVAGLAALGSVGAATAMAGPLDEPVSVTATASPRVPVGAPFPLTVAVAADPGALDIAAPPLRLRVRLAPECGGSFAGTEGPTAIDRVLPAPKAGTAYATRVGVEATLATAGEATICAFLEDSQERQFATDTEVTVVAGAGGTAAGGASCKVATKHLKTARKRSRKLDRRIHRLRREAKHAKSRADRRRLAKKLTKLRRKRHKLVVRSRRAKHAVAVSCGAGRRR